MAVTNRYKHPKLVGGDPEWEPPRLRCICAWGGAPFPIIQWSRNRRGSHSREVHKVALGPSATEADAHTFASLRSLQPRVLPFLLSPRYGPLWGFTHPGFEFRLKKMASISTFARNFAKGKNGQHSNYATFEKNFALFWLTPTHTPAGAPGPSRTKPRAGAPDRHTLTGYRSRGVLDSEGSARQSRASASSSANGF